MSATRIRTGADGLRAIEDIRIKASTYDALAENDLYRVLEIERLGRKGLRKLKLGKHMRDLEEGLAHAGIQLTDDGAEPTPTNPQELWSQTGDLNPQASAATRTAVARLRSLGNGKRGLTAIAAQWPEFVGFVISQITDMRGAMVREDAKFANMIAHTDEILRAMESVGGLSEQLSNQRRGIMEILHRVPAPDNTSATRAALAHFGQLEDEETALHNYGLPTPEEWIEEQGEEPHVVSELDLQEWMVRHRSEPEVLLETSARAVWEDDVDAIGDDPNDDPDPDPDDEPPLDDDDD